MKLLFYKEGFSYCYGDSDQADAKVHHFKVNHSNQWESEVIKELEVNLRLRRNFEQVKAGFISSFFNLVPNEYDGVESDLLLNFSEAEFENNVLLQSETKFGQKVIYGTSQLLFDKLNELHDNIDFFHSAQPFLNTIETTKEATIHLNLNAGNLEIAVMNGDSLQFYNLFDAAVDEDVLFYTLFTMEQLNLDTNKVSVRCYGDLLPKTKVFQTLKKYVRYVNTAMKNEEFLANYTLHKLEKCELSQELLEEGES